MARDEAAVPFGFKYATGMPGIDPEFMNDDYMKVLMGRQTYSSNINGVPDDPASD